MDAEQLAVVALIVVNVHGDPLKLPVAVPVLLKLTVPAGVEAVPAAVSFTNAVQLVDCATTMVVGEHEMLVEVVLRVTVTVLLVFELPV